MSDTSGLQNADSEGVPAEDRPERFETGDGRNGTDAEVGEPDETGVAPEGAEDVTPTENSGSDAAEPPPADFDPAQQPSNPDLVTNTEPPD